VCLVEDVELQIVTSPLAADAKQGTEVQIDNLRSAVSRAEVRRLARALILLADPFEDTEQSFKPVLVAPEFEDIAKLVKTRYLGDADYHLIANVDARGRASAKVVDWKGKVLFKTSHKGLAIDREEKAYACPPTQFDFWNFILLKETFIGRVAKLQDVRAWLEAVGGVHLYQNDLRVSPYGKVMESEGKNVVTVMKDPKSWQASWFKADRKLELDFWLKGDLTADAPGRAFPGHKDHKSASAGNPGASRPQLTGLSTAQNAYLWLVFHPTFKPCPWFEFMLFCKPWVRKEAQS
jgi:hypothetical protein